MGHDIQPISRHNLDISSVQALAEDLAERFEINIDYGIANVYPEVSQLLDPGFGHDYYIPFGKIQSTKYSGNANLNDEYYVERKLFEKYGDSISDSPVYKKHCGIGKLSEYYHIEYKYPYYAYRIEIDGEWEIVSIYQHSICNKLYYFGRWGTLCRAIQYEGLNDNYKRLNGYRKKLMDFTVKTGGDKIYFVDDQAGSLEGIGQGREMTLTWNEIEENIKNLNSSDKCNFSEENKITFFKTKEKGKNPYSLCPDG